jgi:hypothetical protein
MAALKVQVFLYACTTNNKFKTILQRKFGGVTLGSAKEAGPWSLGCGCRHEAWKLRLEIQDSIAISWTHQSTHRASRGWWGDDIDTWAFLPVISLLLLIIIYLLLLELEDEASHRIYKISIDVFAFKLPSLMFPPLLSFSACIIGPEARALYINPRSELAGRRGHVLMSTIFL